MHDAPTDVLTDAYTEDEYLDDLLRVTGGQTDEALARHDHPRHRRQLFDWMPQLGVRFQPSLSGTLHLGRTNAFFLGGGKALMNAYYATAERLGVEILYDAEVVALDIDGRRGSIAATVTLRRLPETRCTPSALVAAAGGFEANLEWLREILGRRRPTTSSSAARPTTGARC